MANVWFAHRTSRGRKFLQKVTGLIRKAGLAASHKQKIKAKSSHPRQPDLEQRQRIERMAMEATTSWYEEHGYKVVPVHKHNFGWDLEAKQKSRKHNAPLLLEVKGLFGDKISIELTPNEYTQMENRREDYRICVVSKADNYRARILHRNRYSAERNGWIDQNGKQLQVTEMTGARAVVR